MKLIQSRLMWHRCGRCSDTSAHFPTQQQQQQVGGCCHVQGRETKTEMFLFGQTEKRFSSRSEAPRWSLISTTIIVFLLRCLVKPISSNNILVNIPHGNIPLISDYDSRYMFNVCHIFKSWFLKLWLSHRFNGISHYSKWLYHHLFKEAGQRGRALTEDGGKKKKRLERIKTEKGGE